MTHDQFDAASTRLGIKSLCHGKLQHARIDLHVGEQLRKARIGLALPISALAKKAELAQALILNVEAGRARPSADQLITLCEGLNLTVGQVFISFERSAET